MFDYSNTRRYEPDETIDIEAYRWADGRDRLSAEQTRSYPSYVVPEEVGHAVIELYRALGIDDVACFQIPDLVQADLATMGNVFRVAHMASELTIDELWHTPKRYSCKPCVISIPATQQMLFKLIESLPRYDAASPAWQAVDEKGFYLPDIDNDDDLDAEDARYFDVITDIKYEESVQRGEECPREVIRKTVEKLVQECVTDLNQAMGDIDDIDDIDAFGNKVLAALKGNLKDEEYNA